MMMTSRHVFTFLMLLGCLLVAGSADANFNVWEPEDGVMIRQADHIYLTNEGTAQAADGSYAVVWSAASDPDNYTQNVFIQAMDASGVPIWPDGGIQVTDGDWAQDDAIVMPYGEDEWIVAWSDYRGGVGPYMHGESYMQRIASDGNLIWDPSGIPVGLEEGSGKFLLPSGESHFYAVYTDSHGAIVQLFDEFGVGQYVQPVDIAAHYDIHVIQDDSTGLLFFARQLPTGALIAHHLLQDGTLEWGESGITVVSDPVDESSQYQVTVDGDGGAFITWRLDEHDTYDVFGQHMDSDGNTIWNDQPVIIAGDVDWAEYRPTHFMEAGEPGTFFMVWNDLPANYEYSSVRIQKVVSVDGAPVLEWGIDNTGLLVCENMEADVQKCAMKYDGESGLFLTWTNQVGGYYDDNPCWLLHFNSNGTLEFESGPILETAMMCSGLRLLITNDELTLISHEPQPGLDKITSNRYSMSTGDHVSSIALTTGFQGDIRDPLIIRSGDRAYMAWRDSRLTKRGEFPFMQCVNVWSGEALWEQHGINLAPGLLDPQYDDSYFRMYRVEGLIDDGFDCAIAAWKMEIDPFDYQNYLQKVNPHGELLWGDEGLHLDMTDHPDCDRAWITKILPSGDGGVYVYYEVRDQDSWENIWIQRYDADGQPVWQPYGYHLVDYENSTQLHEVIQLDDGSMMLIYERAIESNYDAIFAMHVSAEGQEMWPEPVHVLGQPMANYRTRQIRACLVGDDFLVAREVSGNGSYETVRLQMFDMDGSLAWPDAPLIFNPHSRTDMDIASAGENEFWLGHKVSYDFIVNKYNLDGEIVTPEALMIGGEGSHFSLPNMVEDGNNGVYVFWWEYDLDDSALLYTHIAADGSYAKPEYSGSGLYLTDAVYNQEELYVTSDEEGGVLAVWNDFRGRYGETPVDDVYAMRINDTVLGIARQNIAAGSPSWELYPVYPNPFNPSTHISFTLAASADVKIQVFDLLGRRVATLVDEMRIAGSHSTIWNGLNHSEIPAASGIYFIQMTAGDVVKTQKAILMK
jgi:Secretion system C-terminal sorting domain